jgi:hypothetical protein
VPKSKHAPRKADTVKDRKKSQLNIWLGKQNGPEIDELAAREQSLTGRTTTRTDFGRELFVWALDRYREAGSLANLKAQTPQRPVAMVGISRVSAETQEQTFTGLRVIFGNAPSSVIERVVEYVSERAARYAESSRA